MTSLSEHDLKKIRLIEKKIGLFENNKLDLFDLIGELNGLLNILESVPNNWKNDFQREINILEIIYDSIEDGSISKWEGKFKEDICRSTSELKILTSCILKRYLDTSDPKILEKAIEVSSDWLMCPKCQDAWESNSLSAMVICPTCERAFHNPHHPD